MILPKLLNIMILALILLLFIAAYWIFTTDLWESIANMADSILEFMASESRNVAQNS